MHILNDFFYCHSIISGYLCLWAWSTTRFRGVLRHLPVLWRQRQPHPHARRDMRPRWVLLCIRRLPLWTPCELPHLLHKGPHTVIISWFLAHIFVFFLHYDITWLKIFSHNSEMIGKTLFPVHLQSLWKLQSELLIKIFLKGSGNTITCDNYCDSYSDPGCPWELWNVDKQCPWNFELEIN